MADGPRHVPFHSLESMTDNFSEHRVLGSGSYGKVYLGEQEDGEKIAVKILHDMSGHDDVQFDKEFYNLVNLQHQNIVRLVGYCHETRQEYLSYNKTKVLADVTKRALCFEFMENGSLSDYLSDEFNGHGWRNRYAIIKGICNGLKYLHEELTPPIFHLDLKPANILLDKKMIPKIADFGLSRFFKEEKSYSTNSPIGTFGYLPPEFINKNIISNKLDIFSLGVVVIKIIAGPEGYIKSDEMTSDQFTKTVHGNWRNSIRSAGSEDLLESYCEQVKRCVEIALSCVEVDRQKRPTIGHIVNMLSETETLQNDQGGLTDQMSSRSVVQQGLTDEMSPRSVDVHPLQLHFSFRPNKLISCPFHVTNNTDCWDVSVRWVPKHEEATCYYYACPTGIVGFVPPRSTHTFLVTMKQVHQPPANMDMLDIVVKISLAPMFGFEVTIKAACATTCEKTTSEVILPEVDYYTLRSMDVHPTEPWILAAYARRLVIWNYKTQTRMLEREFYSGLAHSLRNFGSSNTSITTAVGFIVKLTEQLFVVGDDDGYIHVYECIEMKRVKEFKAHRREVTSLAVHPTEPLVLSASYDQRIKLWNWEKGWVCIRTFTGHSDCVRQVKFNPHDVDTFGSASSDGTVKTWIISSSIHVTSLDCEEGQACVGYYPMATGGDQQHYMVTGSEDGTARIWDLRIQTCIREIKGLQIPCIVGAVDRPLVLVTASDFYGVSLHDYTTYRSERRVHSGLDRVRCFAYIKGIRSLAIGHEHGIAILEIDRFFPKVLPPVR